MLSYPWPPLTSPSPFTLSLSGEGCHFIASDLNPCLIYISQPSPKNAILQPPLPSFGVSLNLGLRYWTADYFATSMSTHRHCHLKSKPLVSISQQSNFSPPHFTLITLWLPFIPYLYYVCCATLSEPFHLCLYLQKLSREIRWGWPQPEKGTWEEVAQVQKTQTSDHWLNPLSQSLVGGRRRF